MRNLMMPPAFPWRAVAAALVVSLAVFPAGCGDDEEGQTPTAEDTTNSLNVLAGFGEDALREPGTQILNGDAVTGILNVLPLSLPGFLSPARTAPFRASAIPPVMPALLSTFTAPAGTPLALGNFGTYHFDSTSTAGPFEKWVLDTADVPPDGYIFTFTEDDGFNVFDEDSNEVALQGEIRILEVVVDDGLSGPLDDILTHSVLEIAAGHFGVPTPATQYPVLVHAEGTVTLDSNREPTSVRLGDRTANGSTDPEAAFIGRFLFALEIDVTRAEGLADVGLLLQLYDSLEDYVLRVATDVTGLNEETEALEAITLILGYGETTTPANPPWGYTVTLSNFREDPTAPEDAEDTVADVEGAITKNGALVATILGDTDEFIVDEMVVCINTWVFFESDPVTPVSICQLGAALLEAFGGFLPTAVAPLVM